MYHLRFLLITIILLSGTYCHAQQHDSLKMDRQSGTRQVDTARQETLTPSVQNDTPLKGSSNQSRAQDNQVSTDFVTQGAAPVVPALNDSLHQKSILKEALSANRFINVDQPPHFFVQELRSKKNNKEAFFYLMCGGLLILGLFKTFYNHYFTTLFTVYFNTSLRQTQLSEQLLQARLPSFILNIFFVLIAGLFVWLVFSNTRQDVHNSGYYIFQVFIPLLGLIYLIKLSFLKFLGWISGLKDVTDHYIFIIFLVNKLLAIVLIPFVILMAFGKKEWMSIYITLALLCVGLLFLSRYIKSYGLLRQKFPMSIFHFLIFFLGAELIPLFIIFKVVDGYIIT